MFARPASAENDQLKRKQQILSEFRGFRLKHELGNAPQYDELLADIILQEMRNLNIGEAIEAVACTLYPNQAGKENQEAKRQKLIRRLNRTLYLRIFLRLQRNVSIYHYDAKEYFSLSDDSGKFKNGDRSKDIIHACKQQQKQLWLLLENYNKAPSTVDIQYDDPDKEYTPFNDAIDAISGLTDKAMNAGTKVTTGSIVYTGNNTRFTAIAGQVFSIGSFVINVVDFLLIPTGYIYKAIKKEDVPFNTENNIRWGLATVSLALAIIGMALPPAALGIAITTTAITLLISTITMFKFFYDRYRIAKGRERLKQFIRDEKAEVISAQEDAYRIRKQIRIHLNSKHPQMNVIEKLCDKLVEINTRFEQHCETYQKLAVQKKGLDVAHHQHQSYLELGSNILTLLVSGLAIGAAVLAVNPLTTPLAIGLAATAAVVGFGIVITRKYLEYRRKRKQRLIERELGYSTTVQFDTTAKMMEKMYAGNELQEPTSQNEKVRKIAKRLEKLTKDRNTESVVNFFVTCERKLSKMNINSDEFEQIFYELDSELQEKTFSLLKQGIELVKTNDIFLTNDDKKRLAESDKLSGLFNAQGIDIDFDLSSIRYLNAPSDSSSDENRPLLGDKAPNITAELR